MQNDVMKGDLAWNEFRVGNWKELESIMNRTRQEDIEEHAFLKRFYKGLIK